MDVINLGVFNALRFGTYGDGHIAGVTKIDNIPKSMKVLLINEKTNSVISKTFSDQNGNYIFNNLRKDIGFIVLAVDNSGLKNAECKSSRYAIS